MSTRSPLSDAEYHRLSQAVLAAIEAQIDRWLDTDRIDIDAHRSGGLLELAFPNGSRIVVNTQPPLHEIWLAARRGGYHFGYVDGAWRDTKDGVEFHARLSEAASEQGATALEFIAPA
ncbi:MAG: iron donor protein CyaY [Pelomonas sp.]|nr:iron donor protein CyaY [Roseateles sp.]